MLGIFEIILLICGIVALVSGKLPSLVFGKKYRVEGPGARVIGAILVAPLPLAFVTTIVLVALLGDRGQVIAAVVELLLVLLAFVAAAVISRRIRQPVVDTIMGEQR